MSNAIQGLESNLALLVLVAMVLLVLNLVLILILIAMLAELRRKVKSLNLGIAAFQKVEKSDLIQREPLQSSRRSHQKEPGQELPDSLLIEKAIAMVKAETSISQIKSDLGIDDNYLEILIKQHKP